MKFSRQKKAGIEWSALITAILGLIVIGAVVVGVIGPGVDFAKEKFFSENKSKWFFPWTEQEFEPYDPEDYFDKDEIIVGDSMKAMLCALNSVAVGRFDYENRSVCPSGYVKISDEEPSIRYGQTQVGCDDISSEFLSFEDKTKKEAIKILGEAVKDCLVKSKKSKLNHEFVMCAYFDADDDKFPLKNAITKQDILIYLIIEYNKDKSDKDWEQSKLYLKDVSLGEIQQGNAGCIYYDKDPKFTHLWNPDDIHIKDCTEDNPIDAFSCSVTSFELPQIIPNRTFATAFLHALTDPKYLVYYEKFPEEATTFWQVEASDLWNVYTIGLVTAGSMLNIIGGGKAAKTVVKAGSEVLEKGTKKQIKTTAEGLLKSATKKEASQAITDRVTKASLKNVIKTLEVEDQLKMIYGVGEQTSQKIGNLLAEKLGTKSGAKVFKTDEARKALSDDIFEILDGGFLRQGAIMRPQSVIVAGTTPQAYRREIANVIVDGGKVVSNKNGEKIIIKGIINILEKELTPTATELILKRQTYRQFFQQIFGEGTEKEISERLLHISQRSFNKLTALKAIDETLVEKSFSKGLKTIEEIFLGNSIGYKSGDSILEFAKKQVPLRLAPKGWLVTGPGGYMIATIGETVFIGIPKWVKNHQIPLILLLSVYISSIDSGNEKYIPVGVNSIAITQPTLIAPNFQPKVIYKLNEEATQYFIRNKEKPNSVMYLVSPCKANFRVVKRKCDCDANPKASIFNFGSGIMNAEKGTITLKDYEERLKEYEAEKEYKSLSKEEDKEKYVEERFIKDNKVFIDYVETGTIISKLKPSKQISIQREVLNSLQNVIDYEHAVKMCNEIGFLQGLGVTNQAKYDIDCIEIEPKLLDDTYCYDVFGTSKNVRLALTFTSYAVDAAILGSSTMSAGLSLPLLAVSGAGFMAFDIWLVDREKWPYNKRI